MVQEQQTRLWRPGPAEEGREAVLTAAADQFVRHGFNATSMDGIADALGSTKGRVYHYYRGKAEVFLDVAFHGMQDLLAMIDPVADDDSVPPSEQLSRMVHSHALAMMQASNSQRVAVQLVQYRNAPELLSHRETTDAIIALRRRYESRFVTVLQAGIESGEFAVTDASLAAKSLLGSLNWIPMWFRPGGSSDDEMSRIAAFYRDTALRAVSA